MSPSAAIGSATESRATFRVDSKTHGVYPGLIVRLNSWDLWQRPGVVWASVATIPRSSLLVSAIIVFALVLWGLYEGLDLWMDGMQERVRRIVKRDT